MYSIYAALRDKAGLTDYAISQKTGIGRSTLSDWKTGKHTLSNDNLKKIADFFNISIDYLLTGKDPEHISSNGNKYYFDDEAVEMVEFLHKNPEYKTLFNASRKVRPEDIDFVKKMIERTSNYDD